jgi:hypothetical protein
MTKKHLRPGLLTAALILLSNPFVSTLDILPDAIAWLLILLSISGVAAFIPHFDNAFTHAKKLLLITALKAPSYLMVSAFVAGDERQRVMFTLVCFAFTVVELIWLFPFLREFFAGLDYLAERHGYTAIIEPHVTKNNRIFPSASSVAQRAAYIALPAKLILAVLPEFCLLSSFEASGTITAVGRDLASFRPILTAFAFLVALGFCVYFLIGVLPLCRMLRQDEQLGTVLQDARTEALAPIKGGERILRVKYAMWCLTLGSFCMIDVVLDGINYLPSALGVGLMGAAAVILLPLCAGRAKTVLVTAGIALPVSVVTYIIRHLFFAEYSYEALGRIREADRLYDLLSYTSIAETVTLTALYGALCALLFWLISQETGYQTDNVNNYSSHLSLHTALRRKAVVMAALGFLGTAAKTGDVFLRRLTERYKMGAPDGAGEVMGGVILPVYGWFWLVVCGLCLAHFLYTAHLSSVMHDEVAHKYALS